MSLEPSIRELIREHEKAILEHYNEVKRILHGKDIARCDKCGDFYDSSENTFGYCSDDCANGWAD